MKDSNTGVVNFQSSALDLTCHHLRVHPLKENSKIPLLKSYPNLATTDDLIINDWAHNRPQANIGIVTGIESSVFALDIDRRRDGHISLAGLEDLYGKLPPTWTVKTRDGLHIYFSYPTSKTRIKSAEIISGIEVIGDNHNLVAVGSIINGHRYQWSDNLNPDNFDLADAPDWLIKRIEEKGLFNLVSDSVVSKGGGQLAYDTVVTIRHESEPIRGKITPHQVKNLFTQEAVVEKCLAIMGIDAPIGTKFHCPFHQPDNHPSAAILRPTELNRPFVFADFHAPDGEQKNWPLPNIYLALKTGQKPKRLPKPSLLAWSLRLLADAGIIESPVIRAPALTDANSITHKVYQGFQELFALRQMTGDRNAPFSWSFAKAWCGLTEREVSKAIKELISRGYLRVVGKFKNGTAKPLWLFTVSNKKLIGALKHNWKSYKALGQRVAARVVEQVEQVITGSNHAYPTLNAPPESESAPDVDPEVLRGQALLLAKRQALGLSPPVSIS